MFDKRLTELTAADIQAVIDRSVQEDVSIEFKAALATPDGRPDLWIADRTKIGNEAKRDIAKELIAFANTEGGVLILGIAEDGSKRASNIQPIPACVALADRLAQSIGTTTDPRLVAFEYAGIPINDDGSGVCVFRIPRSHRAPHRDGYTKECFSRVGDRSEPMTMRQVQDLVLQRSRDLEDVEEQLERRHTKLDILATPQIVQIPNRHAERLVGAAVRATAVPLDDVFIQSIHRNRQFMFNLPDLFSDGSDGPVQQMSFYGSRNWRPMLRGIHHRETDMDGTSSSEHIITSNGLIECTQQLREDYRDTISPTIVGIHVWHIFKTFVHLLITTEAFRTRYGRPDMEFALDFEWKLATGGRILIEPLSHPGRQQSLRPVELENRVRTYEMPPRDGLPALLSLLNEDVAASCGLTHSHLITVDFERAIQDILRP